MSAGDGDGSGGRRPSRRPHRWVAAALVDVGRGENDRRAERAARTGRYVVPAGTQISVLEVYCADCRTRYRARDAAAPCPGGLAAAVGDGLVC